MSGARKLVWVSVTRLKKGGATETLSAWVQEEGAYDLLHDFLTEAVARAGRRRSGVRSSAG